MPDWNGMLPTTFSVASSMIQNCLGYEPMISVPVPALTFGESLFDCARGAFEAVDMTRATATPAARVRSIVAPLLERQRSVGFTEK